ncbi:MAG: azurin [Betaproteobacteria bacterium]
MTRMTAHYVFALTALLGVVVNTPSTSHAQTCNAVVQSDDALRYTPQSIEVPSTCKDFTVTLTHSGRLPALAMGHNWVLAKEADMAGVARTGMLAGAANQYVDPTDRRVIAHTNVIGGGQAASVSFPVSALRSGETYAFFCTFAGHSPVMQGTLVLK